MERSIESVVITRPRNDPKAKKRREFKRHWPVLLFVIAPVIYVFVFSYLPMYGILVAFQDYVPGDDIIGKYTQWIGWGNFVSFFDLPNFKEIFVNTFLICIEGFAIGFPIPIIVALLLNALPSKRFQKFTQTIFYAPHFISLVVMVGMLFIFFGSNGLINNILQSLGANKVSFFLSSESFRPLFIWSSNWQDFGWSCIIYLAALAAVDPAQHEAAKIDGANRFQRIIHIDFPAILPTVSMLLILSIGNLMNLGYEKVLLMQTDGNLETSEIISTFIYKYGIVGGSYGVSTAAGLFNSAINVVLMIAANYLAKKASGYSMW